MSETICEIKKVNNNLDRLRAQAEAYDYNGITKTRDDRYIELDVEDGFALIVGLHKNHKIALCRNFLAANTTWPSHKHGSWEMFIVYDGTLRVCVDGEEAIDIVPTEEEPGVYVVPKNKSHYAFAPDGNCHFIAVGYPAPKGFPEGV